MKERAHILLLASNPDDANPLEVDRQARTIQRTIEDAGSELVLATRWAVEPLDLLREVRALRPTVLHFSGYGARGAQAGIYLRSPVDGTARLVTAMALQDALAAAGSSVRVVVLDACHTEDQARALLGVVDCVIGVGIDAITEAESRSFSLKFYQALAKHRSVWEAWERGTDARPRLARLVERYGVNARQMFVRAE